MSVCVGVWGTFDNECVCMCVGHFLTVCVCGALFTLGRGTNFPPLYSLHTKLWRQRKIGLAAQRRKLKAISHGHTEKEGKEIYGEEEWLEYLLLGRGGGSC